MSKVNGNILNFITSAEKRVCGAIQSEFVSVADYNIFGKKLLLSSLPGISFAGSIACTGIRTAAIINSSQIWKQRDLIASLAARKVPLVIHVHCSEEEGMTYPHSMGIGGTIEWTSSNEQEAHERAFISHKMAELGLCPVIHWIQPDDKTEISIPSDEELIEFLGKPEQLIDSPLPGQKIVFGDHRRTIPAFINPETPISYGANINPVSKALANASDLVFVNNHLADIIQEALTEFEAITGRSHNLIEFYGSKKASHALLTHGFRPEPGNDSTISHIHLSLLSPTSTAVELLRTYTPNIKRLGILSSVFSQSEIYPDVASVVKGYYFRLDNKTLDKFKEHLLSMDKEPLFMDIDFNSETVNPIVKVLLESYLKEYPHLAKHIGVIDNTETELMKPNPIWNDVSSSPVMRLSRFHNTTNWLHRRNHEVAEPYRSYPIIPSRVSWWNQASSQPQLPMIDETACTGCGMCMVECPYIALPGASLSFVDLLKAATDKLNGTAQGSIRLLIPQVRNLASIVSRDIYNSESSHLDIEKALNTAFQKLTEQLNWDEKHISEANVELESITEYLKSLPLSITELLFNYPESLENGKGELFILNVDPWNCTSCGICEKVCPEDAISLSDEISLLRDKYLEAYDTMLDLPVTKRETTERLLSSEQYSPLAAIYLNRDLYHSMDSPKSEGQSTLRKYLHSLIALTEYTKSADYESVVSHIDIILSGIKDKVDIKISNAVSSTDYKSIRDSISESGSSQVYLDELFKGSAAHATRLNRRELEREIKMIHSLDLLSDLVNSGPTGLGRARYVVAASSDRLDKLLEFPDNPFSGLTYFTNSADPEHEIIGILGGLEESLLDIIRLIRKAELVMKGKYKASIHDQQLKQLELKDLSEEEFKLAPPLLWFTETVPTPSVLNTQWPVKVFILQDSAADPRNTPMITDDLLRFRDHFLWQCSPIQSDILAERWPMLLQSRTNVLTYLPILDDTGYDDIEKYLKSLSLIEKSRLFPEIWFTPTGSFLQGLDIKLNEMYDSPFVEFKDRSYRVSWADFAFLNEHWNSHFQPFDDESGWVTVPDFLEGSVGKPVIITETNEKYSVSEEVIRICNWVYGRYTDLIKLYRSNPDHVRAKLLEELGSAYEEKLQSIRYEFDEKLKTEQNKQAQIIRENLKKRLLELSSRRKK